MSSLFSKHGVFSLRWTCLFFLTLSLSSSVFAGGAEDFEDDPLPPLVNFHRVMQREKLWDGHDPLLPFLYEEYLGKRVHAKGFFMEMEYGPVLSQTPLIEKCCRHAPQRKDLFLIRWASENPLHRAQGESVIVMIEADLILEDQKVILDRAKLIPLVSPWEKALHYLKRLFSL